LNCKSHILLLLSTLLGIGAFSQNIEFIENKGQWDDKVLFAGQVPAGGFFVHADGFTVLQHNSSDWAALHEINHEHTLNGKPFTPGDDIMVRSHAYNVRFVGANQKAAVVPDKPLFTVNNYLIGNDPSQWARECRIFQGITVKDLYPNIDVRYYSDNGTLKYDIIVRPGGNVADIALAYDGVDRLDVKKNELVIGTSVGELRELEPYSYQYGPEGRVKVDARFSVREKTVRFNLKSYNEKEILVIDPTLIFCSFSGSTADNWGFTATYGPDGSMYGGGIVFGFGFPVSTGAFQTNYGGGASGCFGGGFDIGIIKLTPNGTARVYATYIGGAANEMPQSLIVDPQGNLIIAGRSNSPDYPVRGGALIGSGGGWDITLTKLNASGTDIIGSRRIGGSNDDGANITPCGGSSAISLMRNYGDEARSEVNIDGSGNIYLASCTKSNNFPTLNAFQTSLGGKQDGVVLKFNPSLTTMLFSTYFGGPENDATYVLSLNPADNSIYVAGGTESPALPGSSAGTLQPNIAGVIDGFIAVISNDGASLVRRTFVGTGGIDQIYGIQFDRLGFPYIMGQTTGNFPVINATWSQPGGKQFIAKLRPDLSAYVYFTTFGKGESSPDISPVAFLVDRCENVYVSGWGGRISGDFPNAGVTGLPVTPDAIKATPDINSTTKVGQDFYFFVLKRNATQQLYGSFYGQNGGAFGDHVDGGTSRFDENGVIYQAICASCSNVLPFPTTPTAAYPTKSPSANCNLAMVKIAFNLAGVGSGVQSFIEGVPRDTAGCVPLTVDFRDTLLQAVSYEWHFGDGSQPLATTTPNASHTFTAVGTYNVMLIAIDSTSCNIRDTSYLNIKVGATEAFPAFTYQKVGACEQFQYRFDNTSVAPAGFPFSAQAFVWDFGDNTPTVTTGTAAVNHTFASPGTYTVTLTLIDTTYCNAPETITRQVRVAALTDANFTTPAMGCAPYNAVFSNTSSGGVSFTWDFGDGTTSTDVSPEHLYPNVGTYTVTLTAIDSGTCNIIDTKTFVITVQGKPVADFSAAPQPPVLNTPIAFTNLSSPDAVRFKWLFGDGDSLETATRETVSHEYNATNTYEACLVAINMAGCPDTVCREVRTLIEPAVDVPNAFTPLSGDNNSVIYVRGFGFAKMKFTIWARWGEKVFESGDKRVGWDGRYKGKLLPMDVYAYTLEVEFTDGTKASKKGDITLIR